MTSRISKLHTWSTGVHGCKGVIAPTIPNVNTSGCELLSLTKDGFVSFKKVEELDSTYRRAIKRTERKLKRMGVVLSNEAIIGVVEEEGFSDDI